MRVYFNAAKAVLIWLIDGAKPIDPWNGRLSRTKHPQKECWRTVGRGGKFSRWETAKIIWKVYVSVGLNKCFDINSAAHREIESRSRGVFR